MNLPAEDQGMAEAHAPDARPWKPGWYPDPSWPTVVRWWDGKTWTKHTAPNDARASSRGAPPRILRTIVITVCVVLGLIGLVGVAYVVLFYLALSAWSSNK